eukprot:COSAG01_NODE_2029_length_8590_cov_5.719501_8_plen_157_part_00
MLQLGSWQAFLEAPEQQDTHEVMGAPRAATADAQQQQQQQEEEGEVGGGGSQPQLTLQDASFRWAAVAAAAARDDDDDDNDKDDDDDDKGGGSGGGLGAAEAEATPIGEPGPSAPSRSSRPSLGPPATLRGLSFDVRPAQVSIYLFVMTRPGAEIH